MGTSWVVVLALVRRWERRSRAIAFCGASVGAWRWRVVFCKEGNGSADPWERVSSAFRVSCGVLILLELEDCISGNRTTNEEEGGIGGIIWL